MLDKMFGKEVISAIKLVNEQIPKLEREAERCDVDALRLIRSATMNNCRARVNGEIDLPTFSYNYVRISNTVEKFADKCICKKG